MNNNLYNMMNPIKEENYVENYLRRKLGKEVEVHVSFCDSIEWRDSIFKGQLKDIGKDYIVINTNNKDYVIWNIYLDYLIINE
jgi:spore coat protein GerQ